MSALTPRQHEVLRELLTGASNDEIAARLGIGIETVKTHVQQIFRVYGARDRMAVLAEDVRFCEATLDRVLDAMPLIVIIHDPSGGITNVNEAFERISGYSRDEVIGMPLRRILSNDLLARLAGAASSRSPAFACEWSAKRGSRLVHWRAHALPEHPCGRRWLVTGALSAEPFL